MNTIIYIYRGRDDASFKIEKLDEQDYCLIRLGIPVLLWKNLKQLDKEKQDRPGVAATEEQQEGMAGEYSVERKGCCIRRKGKILLRMEHFTSKCRSILKRNRMGEAQEIPGPDAFPQEAVSREALSDEAETQEALREEILQLQVTALVDELQMLQTALCLLGGNTYWTYTVYEERLRTNIDTSSWWDAWKIPEFENYGQPLWVEKIVSQGDFPNLLILGQSYCIWDLLVRNARRLRSVKWYLLQREYTGEAEAFIDSFYEEYGLAIEVHLLDEKKDWCRVCFHCREPVKVLDFTGEEKVSACGVIKGSIWLDMNAMDGKAARMEVRNQGIRYFSLKKLWSQLQKPANALTLL